MFVSLLQSLRPIRGLPIWLRYLLTALLVLLCFGLRYALDGKEDHENLPLFLMFVPAVIVSSFLFDRGSGFFAVAFSAVLGIYFFVPPEGEFTLYNLGDVVRLTVFIVVGIVSASMIEALRLTVDELGVANDRLAASNSALEAARHELSDSFSLLDRIIESSPDPIFVKDRDGRYVHLNIATAGVFGIPKHVVTGRRDRDFLPAHVASRIEEVDREIMAEQRSRIIEERVARMGGEPRIYLSSKTPWFDPDGKVIGLIGSARDIHERKELEERLRKADAQSRLLLDDINHRIKNHLQSVAGMLDLASRRSSTVEEARTALRTGTSRLVVLARVYDRLHMGAGVAAIDARDFLTSLISDLQTTLADDRDITLRVEAAAVDLSSSQAVNIGLIVNELVTNALKHGYPDSQEGEIRIRLSKAAEALELEVADDGVGLGADVRPGSSGQRLVRALAAQLGGAADWQVDGGTKVRVKIPLAENPQATSDS